MAKRSGKKKANPKRFCTYAIAEYEGGDTVYVTTSSMQSAIQAWQTLCMQTLWDEETDENGKPVGFDLDSPERQPYTVKRLPGASIVAD